MWPWNLTDDLENNREPLLSNIKLCASFHRHMWIQTGVTVRKRLNGVMTSVTLTFDLWPWPFAWTFAPRLPMAITHENFRMIGWQEHCQKGVTDRQTDGRTERSVLRAAWSQLKYINEILSTIPKLHTNCYFFKQRPERGPSYRRQVVHPRPQTPQKEPIAKPGTPVLIILSLVCKSDYPCTTMKPHGSHLVSSIWPFFISGSLAVRTLLVVWLTLAVQYDTRGGEFLSCSSQVHDDVIKWNHFSRYWPFVRGIHRSPVNSPHKGQWRRALMFSLICALNKRMGKQSWGWWFETPSRSLWRHGNVLRCNLSMSITWKDVRDIGTLPCEDIDKSSILKKYTHGGDIYVDFKKVSW